MRLVATKSIKPGTELAKTIYSDNGQVLIQRDIQLTQRMLNRLMELGITYLYIKDVHTEDVMVEPPISDELRMEAVKTVKNSFTDIQNNDYMKRSFLVEQAGEKMADMVSHIMSEMKGRKEVISILSDVLISDDYVFSHSVNVTIYSLALANEMGMPSKRMEEIGLGAMLHDVGKMFIPDEVLQKTGKLTDEEFKIIQKHTDEGFNYLRKANNIPLLAAHCAYQHHERLNGTGYPRGITEKDMHPYAKILGVADVFDAVTSDRVYRDAMLPHEGLEILYAGAGELFDKNLVEAFKKTIAIYPQGLTLQLSDGRSGVVIKQNPHLYERPIIRILKENNQPVREPYELDLSEQFDIVITSCNTDL
ncbi:HD-GYP domain-containing protein [Aquibacillus sediminis]|uniref:HD-GYP domain-containing protein n=1 Tax=Aquibacillus sediminis TaxID=2574734 RepID=UPI0011096E6F|nr:HD-GYP domain-containing protein [Aquibacillus sediminis]